MEYGIFGLWTLVNLGTIAYYMKIQNKVTDRLIQLIENNTAAMTRLSELVEGCPRRKQ